MEFISWNVNGIRACLRNGWLDYFTSKMPAFICLQEIKAMREQVDLTLPDGYHQFWYSAEKKGYSGTAIFTRHEPLDVRYGLGIEEHDREGRVITLEYPDFFLVNVYTPNSKRGLERLSYRQLDWDVLFLKHLTDLEKTKPVIFCGDLNVAHKEIDLANPSSNRRNAGFTEEERGGFDNIVAAGFIDTFREFEQGGGHYSWWSYMANSRARNIGWRIDYWGISQALRPRLKAAWIEPQITGSDHCPVAMTLDAAS